jgi:hypothetical protein
MMTDAPIKTGRPDTSSAFAYYVGHQYFSAFVVASVFVVTSFIVAHLTVYTDAVVQGLPSAADSYPAG